MDQEPVNVTANSDPPGHVAKKNGGKIYCKCNAEVKVNIIQKIIDYKNYYIL